MTGRRAGLSLVELLAVLATVALLLAVMVPSLAGAAAGGRRALCTSNLRQMALAAQRYALEYGYFPPALRYEHEPTPAVVAWDWVTSFDGRLLSPGPLWAYAEDPGRVQQCPEYHGRTNFADPYTGYNYNTTYVGGEGRLVPGGWESFRPGARFSACRRTAQVAIFGDGGRRGGTNKFMRAPMNTIEQNLPQVYAGGQAYRHGASTLVAFLDGHVDGADEPRPGTLATRDLLEGTLGYPRNGFLSDDDRAYDPNPGALRP